MNFKKNARLGEIPEIDITPMLNVVMVVLAFFVTVSATLTGEPDTVDVTLPAPQQPESENDGSDSEPPPFLTVSIDAAGEIAADGQSIEKEELLQQIPAYLENYADSKIYFKPTADVSYETVLQTLSDLKQAGGDRVSLVIGATQASERELEAAGLDAEPSGGDE